MGLWILIIDPSSIGVDDMAPSRTTCFVHPAAGTLPPGIKHNLGTDNTSDTEDPTSNIVPARSQHPTCSKVTILGVGTQANATFLTEASFGVAHDKLVQVITDTQPFEPHWEGLSSIDLSNRNIESVARLKEFLPRLHTLLLWVRSEIFVPQMLADEVAVILTS
jgi:protein NUD1